jgi:hypothetical protein
MSGYVNEKKKENSIDRDENFYDNSTLTHPADR